MSDDIGTASIILFVLQLVTVAEVGVGMYMVSQAVKDRRGEFILEVFRRLRDPILKPALELTKLSDVFGRDIRTPEGMTKLQRVALVKALESPQLPANNKIHDWIRQELDRLLDLADEFQGLINMGYISRSDMYAFEPYFQSLVDLPDDTIAKYAKETRLNPERVMQFLQGTKQHSS